MASPGQATINRPVATWSNEDKVEEAIKRAIPLLPDSVGRQLSALLTPEALAITVGVVIVWAASHFVGIGEIADIILLTRWN